jgi:hypothetical protein
MGLQANWQQYAIFFALLCLLSREGSAVVEVCDISPNEMLQWRGMSCNKRIAEA